MRPLRLVMQAFGPYRGEEVVDFGRLGPNRVFLIHGDTGSGKTSILDAMVFALYGETSGGERRADQMRCESAAADVPTEVVFDFLLGERSYRVRRRPAQELQGVRGSAMVAKPAEVILWERTGCSAAEEGIPLATKIRDAETRIRELLGFSCEQFRQVVVLPQGRFRELLSSGSDQREEILRQLFRTERFRELESALADRAKNVRGQMEHLKLQREERLRLAGAGDDAELAALLTEAAAELAARAQHVTQTESAARQAAEAHAAAQAADEARRAVAAARSEVQTLEGRGAEIAALRARLESSVRAERVQPAADWLREAVARSAEAGTACAAAEHELLQAREMEQTAVAALAAENGRLPEREAAAERVRYLEGLTVAIEAWRAAKTEHEEAAGAASSARAAYEEAEGARAEAAASLAALKEDLAAVKTAAAQVGGVQARLVAAEENLERCRRLSESRAAVREAEPRLADLEAAETRALDHLRRAQADLTDIEQRWKSTRAVALAGALQPGKPCPVCGSTEHPAPATATAADVSDEALEAGRASLASARDEYEQAREASATVRNDLNAAWAREQSIREGMGPLADLPLAEAEKAVTVCVAELEALVGCSDVNLVEEKVAEAEVAKAASDDAAKAAADTAAAAEKALAAAEARLAERAAGIPEDLRESGALEVALERARALRQDLQAALDTAQQKAAKATEGRIVLEAAAKNTMAAQAKAADDESACRTAFESTLKAHGFFDEPAWRACLVPEYQRVALLEEVDGYRDALLQATGKLRQAEAALQGLPEMADIEGLRVAVEEARSEHSLAIDRHADSRNHLGRLTEVKGGLAEIDSKSDGVRRDYETVGLLAEVANGQNPSRVSFQRWVLGVYLDEVLVTASRRLYAMSKGRYQLERQREVAHRRRASGLDLAVFDEFSGTSRPAVTLSGGESFLAALALALGLAETVQEYAAGTPLETIFVDEGFGALDADALELAVDALMELQSSGRLVGVISHVAELKQVIPARLEVRGGSTGSSTQFVVP